MMKKKNPMALPLKEKPLKEKQSRIKFPCYICFINIKEKLHRMNSFLEWNE